MTRTCQGCDIGRYATSSQSDTGAVGPVENMMAEDEMLPDLGVEQHSSSRTDKRPWQHRADVRLPTTA